MFNIKKNWILLTCLLLIIFSIANVSASIYFSQLNSVYNLGEMVEMNVIVSPEDAGPLRIVLFCDNNTLEVYKGAPTELIQLPLTTLWMNGMTGECYFKGYYGRETKESTIFKISKKLDISLYTTSFFAKPSETIKISGTAKRLNGEGINGDVEVRIPLLTKGNKTSGESIYGVVNNGEFSVDYTIKQDAPAGDYRIDIVAYEKTENERTSEGITTAGVQVSQVIKSIDIALDTQNIEPGKTINFKPILNDQSDNPLIGDVAIEIRDENSNKFIQEIVKSGETIEYTVPNNMTAGYYEIEASSNSLVKVKKFHVTEKALVSFELVNGTLVIRNIGNIPYNKTIEVTINGRTFFIKPEDIGTILPGEKKEFKLTGDKALNSVKVDDKTANLTLENVSLPVAKEAGVGITGATVGISDIVNTPITWIIILVILAAIILFLFRDVFKKRSVAYPAPLKSRTSTSIDTSSKIIKLDGKGREIGAIDRIKSPDDVRKNVEEKAEKGLSPIKKEDKINPSYAPYKSPYSSQKKEPLKEQQLAEKTEDAAKSVMSLPGVRVVGQKKVDSPNEAEQTLVTDGQKNRAAVIALKIKNEISKFSKDNLEKAIEHVYDKKGAVYEHGNFIFVIFSPIITKSFRNEIDATKAAEKIAEGLKEHNRKFSDKIEFGIAINSGDIINKIEDKKLKFTSLGTLTISAKKLAELSNGEVLLTKEAYEKAMSEVKAEKKQISGTEVYEVKKVADYDKNKKFINDFLKRESEARSRSMIPNHAREIKSNPYWMKDEKKEENPLIGINDNQNAN